MLNTALFTTCLSVILGYYSGLKGIPFPFLGYLILLFLLKIFGSDWKKIFYIIACTQLSSIYFAYRTKQKKQYFPAKEVSVSAKIHKLFSSKKNRISGIASIEKIDKKYLRSLVGEKLFFILPKKTIKQASEFKNASVGETWNFRGRLRKQHFEFGDSFQRYLWSNEVCLRLNNIKSLHKSQQTNRLNYLYKRFSRALNLGENEETRAVYKAMLLGNKLSIEKETKDVFFKSGILHLFAVSGLHVGVLSSVTTGWLAYLLLPQFLRSILTLIIIYTYVQTIGAPPSAFRAFLMLFFWSLGYFLQRKPNAFASLCLSFLLILIIHPTQLWNVGFQLSYLIVASIIMIGIPLSKIASKYLLRKYEYMPTNLPFLLKIKKSLTIWIVNVVSISFAASLMAQLLNAHYWGTVTPLALIINIAIIPIASCAITLGGISLVLGLSSLTLPICYIINYFSDIFLKIIKALAGHISSLPFSIFELKLNSFFLTSLLVIFLILSAKIDKITKKNT